MKPIEIKGMLNMTISEIQDNRRDRRKERKEIEHGILKAIAEIADEDDWPEGADACDVQSIITQLARSAAHLRDKNASTDEKTHPKNLNAK